MSGHQSTTYNSIYVLSVLNYDRFTKTGDTAWLERDHIAKKINYDEVWKLIEDEIINEIGVDDLTTERLTLINDLLIAEIDLALTGDRKLNNKIRKIEQQLNELNKENDNKSGSIVKSVIDISRVMGYRLDPATVTVYEYLEAMKTAEQISKEQLKKQPK